MVWRGAGCLTPHNASGASFLTEILSCAHQGKVSDTGIVIVIPEYQHKPCYWVRGASCVEFFRLRYLHRAQRNCESIAMSASQRQISLHSVGVHRNIFSCAEAQPDIAGWSSLVARRAHNPEVVGSNPAPATKNLQLVGLADELFCYSGTVFSVQFSASQTKSRSVTSRPDLGG